MYLIIVTTDAPDDGKLCYVGTKEKQLCYCWVGSGNKTANFAVLHQYKDLYRREDINVLGIILSMDLARNHWHPYAK